MKDLPYGYGIWYISDNIELTTPDGTRFIYPPETPSATIVEAALTHQALNSECMWGPDCPVCEDRRRRGWVA